MPRHQRPGRNAGAGTRRHVANRLLVGVPFVVAEPVFPGDLEAFELNLLARIEAF